MQDSRISIEFFPPRDREGQSRLLNNVVSRFDKLRPEFFSVTYGAGGSTRDGTRQTVSSLHKAGFTAVPHLSMGTDDRPALHALLDEYRAMGIKSIVAIRGDQTSGVGSYRFNNAEALINIIRAHAGDHFDLIVAAYPEVHPDAESATSDLHFFQSKVEAGASRAITQYFYNADAYENFMDRCQQKGISIPIYPGIMPITNFPSLVRFSERCGADIPRWLMKRLLELSDDSEALNQFGVDYVTGLCERLLKIGAPGFHFFTLNRWGATTRICAQLNLAA